MLNNFKTKNAPLFFILAAFIILQSVYLLFPADLWWDASVYLGMGKHAFSAGKSGLWEPSRALAWPLVLGILWKIGADPVLFGSIITIGLSAACILLTYAIARNFFDDATSLIAALFIAFSPTFFLFTSVLQSEIPSLFFLLLGAYLFLRKKLAASGFIFGISFMTRFFTVFAVIPFFAELIRLAIRQKSSKKFIAFTLAFLIPLSFYLISNQIIYSNAVYPFMLQLFMTQATGSVFNQPFSFYLIGLFKENMFVVFSVIGICRLIRKNHAKNTLILPVMLIAFIPFALVHHKEMRFLLPLMPFLYIITAYGITSFLKFFKWEKIIIFLFISIWIFMAASSLKLNHYHDNLSISSQYLTGQSQSWQIWTSNPLYSVYLDKRIDEMMYYPTFNHEKFLYLKNNMGKAGTVLLGSCDIYCEPYNNYCEADKMELITLLRNNLKIAYYKKEGQCESFIFSR